MTPNIDKAMDACISSVFRPFPDFRRDRVGLDEVSLEDIVHILETNPDAIEIGYEVWSECVVDLRGIRFVPWDHGRSFTWKNKWPDDWPASPKKE